MNTETIMSLSWEEWTKTKIKIKFATKKNISDIVTLRQSAPDGSLRTMTEKEIKTTIEEFRIVTLGNRAIWCCRIFNNRVEKTLELWSIVGRRWYWVWKTLIQIAEDYANSLKQPIIAVTRNLELSETLSKRWWKNVTEKYPERISQSGPSSIIWQYNPTTK